jgi:hypothetical protein
MNEIKKHNSVDFMKSFLCLTIEERLNKDLSNIDLTDETFIEKVVNYSKNKNPSTLWIISFFLKSFLDIESDESIRYLPQDLFKKSLRFLYPNFKPVKSEYHLGRVNIYLASNKIFSLDFNETKKDRKPSQIYNLFLKEYISSLRKTNYINEKFKSLETNLRN